MKVSIQVNQKNEYWDDCEVVLHTVKTWDEAVNIAYAISHQLGNASVRLADVSRYNENNGDSIQDYAGRLSGTYIQSTEVFPV